MSRLSPPPGQLIETVNYNYTLEYVEQLQYYNLTQVNYAEGPPATYTYLPSNPATMVSGRIETCNDVRYTGAMSRIRYEYADPGQAGQGGDVGVGQIKREKNLTTGQTVSEVIYPQYDMQSDDPNKFLRIEMRPDGATRSFRYNHDGSAELQSYTDFQNHSSSIQFANASVTTDYLKITTDARGNPTTTEKTTNICAVMSVTHPGGSSIQFTYSDPNNPVYVSGRKDENNHWTYYDRDGANRVWQTRYPDGSAEQFTYNGFGQIETHTMTSGGVENIRYDGRGLKYMSWPPATSSDPDPWNHPTRYYYYPSGLNTDRLWYVVDPRNNATWFEYNGRGQVTKMTHQDGSYVQSGYNPDGTLAWTADENHPGAANDPNQRTRYIYDEYKRVLTVTNPLNQTITNSYEPWSGIGSFSHTTSSVYRVTSPMEKITDFNYDENFRRIRTTQAPGTSDQATTTSTYDPAGNLETLTEPNGQPGQPYAGAHSTFGYDNRNRQTTVTDAQGHVTSTTYDDAGNKRIITRPGNSGSIQYVEYDPMNRLKHQIDEGGVHTYLHYDDAARNLTSQEDGNGKTYSYAYDQTNRKTVMTYPDTSHEDFSYDTVGNLATHRNRAGAVQTFAPPDNRNRPTSFSWSNDPQNTQGQSFEYDFASRVRALHNAEADIVNTYDDANRKTSETETIKSYGLWAQRSTVYQYDDDGNRKRLTLPRGYQFLYGYTQRHQLDNIKLDPAIFGGQYNTPLVRYTYDASGNRTRRTALSGAHPECDRDELNRIRAQANYFANECADGKFRQPLHFRAFPFIVEPRRPQP